MNLPVPHEVFDFFAADPAGPFVTLARLASDTASPVFLPLNSFLQTIPAEVIEAAREDKMFRFLMGRSSNIEWMARIWVAERFLSDEIARRKLRLLCDERRAARPRPYDTRALAGLDVDPDHLVALSAFSFDGSRLTRNGYAFSVLAITSSPNSSYWLLRSIYDEGIDAHTRVRLDPFLFGPERTFSAMSYKMLVYGRPFDWEKISGLRKPDHGKWRPDASNDRSEFTEYCWTPRGREVNFVCEEVPKRELFLIEPSRYLHAVYESDSRTITHLDGALRILTSEEIEARHSQHVRNSGKLGLREKVFRTDKPVPQGCFSVVVQAFYVWNQDVQVYFTQALAPS